MDKHCQPAMEFWYPLTYPGGYTETLTEEPSSRHEYCALDVAAFRGRSIRLQLQYTGDFFCALTDDDGALLSAWQTIPETLTVPENAQRLYLTNDHTACPDFYLTVPAGARPTPNGLLFSADFTGFPAHDETVFLGARITQINDYRHASLCSVDFAAGKLQLYQSSNGEFGWLKDL